MKKVLVTTLLILTFILLGTGAAIFYAKGYRIIPGNQGTRIEGTGLLVLTSKPDGARVLINDHLSTATNNTINLEPGEYNVKIEKDGYFPWHKKINIKKEVVSQVDALLFPTAPKLESVTITGAHNPIIDSSNSLIAFTSSASSTIKSGIYILDMSSKQILPLSASTNQIASDTFDKFSQAQSLSFSPDGTQLLASIQTSFGTTSYLLSAKGFNQNPNDITATLFQLQKDWKNQEELKNKKLFDSMPRAIQKLSTENFKIISLSPDENKILYEASQTATLPFIIKPKLPDSDSTAEQRNIEKNNYYVYNMKEDKNYLIFDMLNFKEQTIPKLIWHPDSKHLYHIKDKKINVIEYDGQNATVIYAGPFTDSYIFPWPDGSSILILTNLNTPDTPLNLYRVDLR